MPEKAHFQHFFLLAEKESVAKQMAQIIKL